MAGSSSRWTARTPGRRSHTSAGTRTRERAGARRSCCPSIAAPVSALALFARARELGAGARLRHSRDNRGRGRRGEPRLGAAPRFPRGRPPVTTRARPDRHRSSGRRPARGRRDRELGRPARPDGCPLRGRLRGVPGRAGSGGAPNGLLRDVALERHARRERPARSDLHRPRRGRGGRLREAVALELGLDAAPITT